MKRIGIPEAELLPAPVQTSNLVAQAKVMFVLRHFLEQAELVSVNFDRPSGQIFLQDIPLQVGNGKAESVVRNANA